MIHIFKQIQTMKSKRLSRDKNLQLLLIDLPLIKQKVSKKSQEKDDKIKK